MVGYLDRCFELSRHVASYVTSKRSLTQKIKLEEASKLRLSLYLFALADFLVEWLMNDGIQIELVAIFALELSFHP